MVTATQQDPWNDYFWDDAPDVLRNKYGITNRFLLNELERSATTRRAKELDAVPLPGNYDFKHLIQFHKTLFQDTYDWAGQVRAVDMSKKKQTFVSIGEIGLTAATIERQIRLGKYFRGLKKEQFVEAFSFLHSRLDKLHPFREGNGRTTQAFLRQLASDAGYVLDFSKVTKEGLNTAAASAYHGDLDGLRFIFNTVATPRRALEFENSPIKFAIAQHPELLGAAKRLYETKAAGKNVADDRRAIQQELNDGRLVGNDRVTIEESQQVMYLAASYRGLTTIDNSQDSDQERTGKVVAVSAHHVLLKTAEGLAICYQRDKLARQVSPNDNITVLPAVYGMRHAVKIEQHTPLTLKPQPARKILPINNGAPVDVIYKGAVDIFVKEKFSQAQRIGKALETQADKQATALRTLLSKPPSRYFSLVSTKRAWQKAVNEHRARLGAIQDRLERVHAIAERQETVEKLAETRMRYENPALAAKYDVTRQAERIHQLNEQARTQQTKQQTRARARVC